MEIIRLNRSEILFNTEFLLNQPVSRPLPTFYAAIEDFAILISHFNVLGRLPDSYAVTGSGTIENDFLIFSRRVHAGLKGAQ
jgi:hypothetical protein